MSEGILKQKTYYFALKVVGVYKQIVGEHKEYVLSRQFFKAGTAPGALVREAEFGQSKADFISRMSIALKEANECDNWINLLKDPDIISQNIAAELLAENLELIKMLTATIKTTKKNILKMKNEK